MSVSLTPSVSSPAPLGTVVTWSATALGADPGTVTYAFRVRPANGAFRPVMDFGPKQSLNWTTIQKEGSYEMEVSAKNGDTGEVATTSTLFAFNSLVIGTKAVVTPTAHPLVYIYSASSCAAGSRMRVEFKSPDGVVQDTPWQACKPAHSMNFYLAGLRASTRYSAYHMTDSGTFSTIGTPLSFVTSEPTMITVPAVTRLTPSNTPTSDGVLLQSVIGGSAIATDLFGNVVWYSPSDISFVTRVGKGGTFLAVFQDQAQAPSHQFFREFDLAGITQAETNAARVSEQLVARGMHGINGFHHEARKLQGGGYLVLADSERILTDVQGPGDVDVMGDTIIVLNENLQVEWAWDAFDHLDTSRAAVEGETCTAPDPGCANWYLATTANDWLHGNALQLTPDGNILYSSRHQDWLFKIDYQNGMGTGVVLWRLGKDGDFQMKSDDPNPWFSHQHDANFEGNNKTMTLFDDGNARAADDPAANSRGQVLSINEEKRTAKLVVNADLGSYSQAVGSAQKLSNGNYHFDSGFIRDAAGNFSSQSVEVDSTGSIVFAIKFAALEYRTFRMADLYTEP